MKKNGSDEELVKLFLFRATAYRSRNAFLSCFPMFGSATVRRRISRVIGDRITDKARRESNLIADSAFKVKCKAKLIKKPNTQMKRTKESIDWTTVSIRTQSISFRNANAC